ncbi:ribosomal protection-like ABC-F family protein [Sporocytophaga myxococcoides]|uniref:ribosomal protection-like ABC-F family protein n=1 Tax=Sporocytophaga myxococcoides TaxID=153721 RepID=UPI0003F57778|nr:ABC-F family ATP-binding cassette domain-containing protein [Sporocytophaga myxococcoides]
MIILQNLTYIHSNKDLLFDEIHLAVNNHDKIALIGNNGSGKSTLMKIIAGVIQPSGGFANTSSKPYYVPQIFGQYNEQTIAQALQIEDKLNALSEILKGNVTDLNFSILNDDWTIEERSYGALAHWGLQELELKQQMGTLSGGQKTKVFLAGIMIHQPDIILMDEPSNHLDIGGRALLYEFIQSCTATLLVISHDRKLLNMLDTVIELSTKGLSVYGGNYDFYKEQKQSERQALDHDLKSKEKELRKAKETEREAMERQQRADARGKKKQEKAGLPRISMNTFKNKAENSTARTKGVHSEKTGTLSQELSDLRKELPEADKIKFGFDNSALHKGKILCTAKEINHSYDQNLLWKEGLSFQITSGERLVVKGLNGRGKTTLIKIILGKIKPLIGTLQIAESKTIYVDQEYSIISNILSVYEQAQKFNTALLQEHEVKIRLNRFLFTKDDWDKPCGVLSGGEKMRLMLCCLTISSQVPDIILLDEPTNNLDIQNVEIMTAAINEYEGTLIVISHDEYFLEQIGVERVIELK